jgi:8-amino-7-oxononanoate synthase
MDGLGHLDAELAKLRDRNILRHRRGPLPPTTLVLCSNDYLGFAAEPLSINRAAAPSGAGASRLVCGDHQEHRELEQRIAEWLQTEAALVFSSGYAANVGTLTALCQPGDVIVSDELNHASIIDGCRLSRATVRVVPHLDPAAIELALAESRSARRRWVVTETYFSMDGNTPELGMIRDLCQTHDAALIVDEAHAVGVFGTAGRGLCHQAGVVPDVLIGTLSKAIGLQGAFVAGNKTLCQWLWNGARPFVFSTGVSPWLAAAATQRIEQVAGADARRATLEALSARFRDELTALAAPLAPSHGPIVPWLVGRPQEAVALSERLLERGIFVSPIRPPTVPEGSSRLRFTVTAGLTLERLDWAVGILGDELTGT